jgi:pimeloyl-ACP methyl ester carboxylesterase
LNRENALGFCFDAFSRREPVSASLENALALTMAAEVRVPCREYFETVAGCRTRIMRHGEGEPLLYLHGARGASAWLPFMRRLSAQFDVIVPEHPGFGGSDTPGWLDNVGDLAYFYLDLIEALNLRRLHLAGVSLGGWIAAELAVRDDGALATLTLIAPAGLDLKDTPKGDIFAWSREELTRNLFHDPAFAQAALAIPPGATEQRLEAKNRQATERLAAHPPLFNPDLHKWLHRIAVPTLLVWGDDDRVIPAAYGEAFRALIPGARLSVIEHCGHAPQIEKAEELARLLAAFIAR